MLTKADRRARLLRRGQRFAVPAVSFAMFFAALALALIRADTEVVARPAGIVGYSGNPATNDGQDCSECHGGGLVPVVSLDGPALVAPGAQAAFTLTVAEGQYLAAGFNVSVTDGFLAVTDSQTRLALGELTHSNPRIVDHQSGAATFNFAWTAPSREGATITMYGAGNSVDGDTTPDGDASATVVKAILVSSAPQPTATDTSAPSVTATAASTPPSPTGSPSPSNSATPDASPTGIATITATIEATPRPLHLPANLRGVGGR